MAKSKTSTRMRSPYVLHEISWGTGDWGTLHRRTCDELDTVELRHENNPVGYVDSVTLEPVTLAEFADHQRGTLGYSDGMYDVCKKCIPEAQWVGEDVGTA